MALTAVLIAAVLAAAGAAPAAAAPVHLTIEVNGYLLIHQPIWERARALAGGHDYNFAPLLRRIRP